MEEEKVGNQLVGRRRLAAIAVVEESTDPIGFVEGEVACDHH